MLPLLALKCRNFLTIHLPIFITVSLRVSETVFTWALFPMSLLLIRVPLSPCALRQNSPPNLFLTDFYFISTKAAIPIFYFNNMPKRSGTINRKRFCPNSKNRICKMPPMVLNLWARSFGGWSRI